jgi:hypothetical protein
MNQLAPLLLGFRRSFPSRGTDAQLSGDPKQPLP